jgi:hypothetical protein
MLTVEIFNMPKEINGSHIVARRDDDASLWYYGVYDSKEKASEVAQELGNGIVVEDAK